MKRARVKVVLVAFAVVCLVGFSVPPPTAGQTFTPEQTEDFVIRLYEVVLQRPADLPGFTDHVTLALSLGDNFVRTLTQNFLLSSEFTDGVGAGFGTAPTSFVLTLYLSILNRVPTLDEIGLMAAALDMDRASMIMGFFDSPEYQLVVLPMINTPAFLDPAWMGRPFTLTTGEHAAYLTKLYEMLLQRDPDPVGFEHNLALLKAGGREFIDDLVVAFLMSAEFEALTSSSPQDWNKVAGAFYLLFLDRQADPAGLAHHAGRLAAGEVTIPQLVQEFMWHAEGRAVLQRISDCLYLMHRPGDPTLGWLVVYTPVADLLSYLGAILTIEEQVAWEALEDCFEAGGGLAGVLGVISPATP